VRRTESLLADALRYAHAASAACGFRQISRPTRGSPTKCIPLR
jgi:hypothetical protein